jgi:hypothetical protein
MSDALYELTAVVVTTLTVVVVVALSIVIATVVAIVALPCAAVGWLWRRLRPASA